MSPTEQALDNIEKWVSLLESGEYPQCRGHLKTDEGYCCLGVAADAVLNLPNKKVEYADDYYVFDDIMTGTLDFMTTHAMGLANGSGDGRNMDDRLGHIGALSSFNDRAGYNFKQIANLILVDLRTDAFGFFTPEVRNAWLDRHNFRRD